MYLLGELKEKPKAAGRKICYNYPEKKELKKKAACRQDGQEVNLRELYPAHYTCFHCIASSCDFSCCREWKIYADDITFRKWQKKEIRKVTRRVNGQRVVRLLENLDCPHLAGDGLCRIITKYGEELIPETCRSFPREVREYPDRRERSLMLACPAVVDLLSAGFSVLQTGSPEESGWRTEEKDEEGTGGPEGLRKRWMHIIRGSATPEEAFIRLFRVPEDHPAVPAYAQEEEEAQLYADLTENYRAEGYYRRFWEEETDVTRDNMSRENETLWRTHTDIIMNCILNDVWSECLKPGFTEREMQLKLEWTALKYAAVRHFLRIRPYEGGFRTVRNGIVLMTRIMSMDDEEIFAWLHDMFDGTIWGPEYPALLFG